MNQKAKKLDDSCLEQFQMLRDTQIQGRPEIKLMWLLKDFTDELKDVQGNACTENRYLE
jgi:hypothetical protein